MDELAGAFDFAIGLTVLGTFVTVGVAHHCMGMAQTFLDYLFIFVLAVFCKVLGSNSNMRDYGFGDSFWAIILGLVFGNIARSLFKMEFLTVLNLEFFIKIGIVLLAMDATQFVEVGPKGLVVAWVETVIILLGIQGFGIYVLKMDRTEAVVTAAGVSICGSSAAMAIGETIKAPKEMLMSLITVMSLFTVPLIPLVPLFARNYGLEPATAGAWIGGSVDSTGAVIAAASLGGEDTLHSAVIIKMLQNLIIGPITLACTMIFHHTYRLGVLWEKFPKFVLGFVVVCAGTTILKAFKYDVAGNSFITSEWFSAISFVLIGIDIDIFTIRAQLVEYKKVWVLYVLGQILDTFTTLGVAYLIFTVL